MVKKIKKTLLESLLVWKCYTVFMKLYITIIGEEKWERKKFFQTQGYELNLSNPQTLNEKMAWLKLNYLEDFYKECCDKYLVHQYLKKKLGKDIAPRLIYVTQNPLDLTFENIKEFPCIIKTSNGSGTNLIVKSKEQYTEKYLQTLFKRYVIESELHTISTREHQYDIEKPYIVVETLLQDNQGGIPNDYKFLYINGKLEFVYCSVDRMGANVRQVYDDNWNRLHFVWVEGADENIYNHYEDSLSIPKPNHFDEMKEIADRLSKDFPMVRIDFYETNGSLYIGEITLHHGSAHDRFYPKEYDVVFGKLLTLPEKNR